jgi:DNA mismatch repair ATPase MutS
MRALALIFSVIAFAVIVWWVATEFVDLDARLALLAIGSIEGLFALSIRTRILPIVHAVEEPAHDLDLLAQILAVIEKQQFHSPRLAALRRAIEVEGGSYSHRASHRIQRLHRWMELLDSRDNTFVRVFGPLLLWTTQLAMGVESWRAENGPRVAGWLDAVSEIEALSSLANYAWEHPSDPFPEFTATESLFDAVGLGHPLLPEDRCVRNSLTLADPLRLLIVSGSNMSGKSTLLRTVGVNTVLALAGAPVRAERLTLTRLSLGASIRTVDSLEEGHSRFMAEILRLKQVLELAPPSLFLLDELLHGTNSHDRALGSEGLIRALLARGAIGLVTTHDLSLARVAEELAPAAANVHFEDRLEGGRLVFDYRMRPGIVARSNALDLMRAVGLDV